MWFVLSRGGGFLVVFESINKEALVPYSKSTKMHIQLGSCSSCDISLPEKCASQTSIRKRVVWSLQFCVFFSGIPLICGLDWCFGDLNPWIRGKLRFRFSSKRLPFFGKPSQEDPDLAAMPCPGPLGDVWADTWLLPRD